MFSTFEFTVLKEHLSSRSVLVKMHVKFLVITSLLRVKRRLNKSIRSLV